MTLKDDDITTNEEYENVEELDQPEIKGEDQPIDPIEQNQSEEEFAGEAGSKQELREGIVGDTDTKDDE